MTRVPQQRLAHRVGRPVLACGRLLDRHPWLVTLALCVPLLVFGVHGPDLPAQEYRQWLFRTHGFVWWDNHWYGGHAVIGYSVLFTTIAALLGPQMAGVVASVASTAIVARLVGPGPDLPRRVARLWFAVAIVADVVVGRLPFAVGLAFGLGALLAVQRRRSVPAALLAAACALTSPLAGLSLLVVGVGLAVTLGWRRALPLATAVSGLVVAGAFGEGGGRFPFPAMTLASVTSFVVLCLVLAPRGSSVLRGVVACYGLAVLGAAIWPNPVGGNIARVATIVGGPVAAWGLLRAGRRTALAVLTVPLLAWQFAPVVSAVAYAYDDPSSSPRYYSGLLSFLSHQDPATGRVEVPFTREHWEAVYVAERAQLARGWERQIDLARNEVLYQPLTAATYHRWLADNAVRFVALPDVPLDPSGEHEARLLRTDLPWLRVVYRDAHWTVWQVRDAVPLAHGAGRLVRLRTDTFRVQAHAPGWTLVRLRWTSFWHVRSGSACLAPYHGWTAVYSPRAGPIDVVATVTTDRDRCTTSRR